jgi:YidC/Oxa1 family membrane protein insertase
VDRESIIRMVAAVAISMGLMLVFQFLIAPHVWPPVERPAGQPAPEPPAEKPAPESPAPEKPEPGSITSEPPSPETPAPEAPAPEEPVPAAPKAPELMAVGATGEEAEKPAVMGSARYGSDYNLEVHVTPRGGAVQRLSLARDRFFKTVADRGEKDPDKRQAMDLVEASAPFAAFAIPELRVWFTGADGPSVVDLSDVLWRLEREACSPTEAVASVEVQTADGKPAVRVTKQYTLRPRVTPSAGGAEAPPQYEVGLAVKITALGAGIERVAYVLRGAAALPREDVRGDLRLAAAGVRSEKGIGVETVAGAKLAERQGQPEGPPALSLAGPTVVWVGEVDKYFAVVMIPQKPSPEGTFAAGAEAFRYEVTEFDTPTPMAGVRLLTKEQALAAGETVENVYSIYAGPKDPKVLEAYAEIGLPGLITWGTCCPIPGLGEISRIMVLVLEAFRLAVGNYGLAIIMLVVVLRLVLHPVTRWSSKSMSKMQTLGPKMEELRKKHGDKKEQLNQEMMKLYREEGINPVTGCLPMFLQTPIWIALYSALGTAIALRHAYFIPPSWLPADSVVSLFLQDLSAPDGFLHWTTPLYLPGRDIPYIGPWVISAVQRMLAGGQGGITYFNLLPILVGVSMYLQQKMTPQASGGPQADQQRKMMNLMSVFFALMLYSLPSGLCLYISVSSFLGFFEQRYLKKRFAAAEASAAAKPGEPSPPKPPKKAGSLVAGRHKTIAERIEAWLQKRREKGKKSE